MQTENGAAWPVTHLDGNRDDPRDRCSVVAVQLLVALAGLKAP